MQVKGKKSCKIAVKMGVAAALFMAAGLGANSAMAQVTGPCINCHTMHNSQGGNEMVHVGAGAGWNQAAAQLETGPLGGPTGAPRTQLLKTDCVGCHSNTSTATIVSIGTNKVPIVFNTSGYPDGTATETTALAGGNFYNVAGDAGSEYGHNVRGISTRDTILSYAPGIHPSSASSCLNSCHSSFTLPVNTDASVGYEENGCKGCHTRVAHHDDTDTSYRYLGGAGSFPHMAEVEGGAQVAGNHNLYEDADWEQTNGPADHNFYKKNTTTSAADKSLGRFCAGCHLEFHAMGKDMSTTGVLSDNGGDDNTDGLISANSNPTTSNPWLRHPSGVNLPLADAAGEYAQMASAGNNAYSPTIPVAQAYDANRDIISAGDQVMCLSCHRAHGSQFKDALRFDYSSGINGMNAHTGSAERTDGCFYCHRNKDI